MQIIASQIYEHTVYKGKTYNTVYSTTSSSPSIHACYFQPKRLNQINVQSVLSSFLGLYLEEADSTEPVQYNWCTHRSDNVSGDPVSGNGWKTQDIPCLYHVLCKAPFHFDPFSNAVFKINTIIRPIIGLLEQTVCHSKLCALYFFWKA